MMRTALHIAVKHDNIAVITSLLRRGASPDVPDSMGRTPIHAAIEGQNIEALDAMIKAGADLSSQDSEGRTPLHLASALGRGEAMAHIILAGGWFATVEHTKPGLERHTNLAAATFSHANRKTQREVRDMIRTHAGNRPLLAMSLSSLWKQSGYSKSSVPLVARRRLRLIQWRSSRLMGRGMEIAFIAASEGRPLELARRLRQGKQASGLFATGTLKIPEGVEGAGETVTNVTCMMAAAANGHSECVKTLVEFGWQLSLARQDSKGRTALWWARDLEIRNMLLSTNETDAVDGLFRQCDDLATVIARRRSKLNEYVISLATEHAIAPALENAKIRAAALRAEAEQTLNLAKGVERYLRSTYNVAKEQVREAVSEQDAVRVAIGTETETLINRVSQLKHRTAAVQAAMRDAAEVHRKEASIVANVGELGDAAELRAEADRFDQIRAKVAKQLESRLGAQGRSGQRRSAGAASGAGAGDGSDSGKSPSDLGASAGVGSDTDMMALAGASIEAARMELAKPKISNVRELPGHGGQGMRKALGGDIQSLKLVLERVKSKVKELSESRSKLAEKAETTLAEISASFDELLPRVERIVADTPLLQ